MWRFSKRRLALKKINNYADGLPTLTQITSLFIIASSAFGYCCFVVEREERNCFRQAKQVGFVYIDFFSHSAPSWIGIVGNEFCR